MTTDISTPVHRAAVITANVVHYGNGTATPAPASLHRDLVAILAGVPGRFFAHSTLIIDAPQPADYAQQLDRVRAAGWQVADPSDESIGGWALFHRDHGTRTVAIGWRPAMRPSVHLGVLVTADADPGTLAMLLDRFHQLTGHSWRGTPATTAHAGIRLSWPLPAQQPRWNEDQEKGPGHGVGALTWTRNLSSREETWGFLHTFDANAAYLGAAINAELPWSELVNVGRTPFDKSLPGYWLITTDGITWPDDGRPPLFDERNVTDGATWVTTPYAEFLRELGSFDVLDSWLGASGGRAGHRAGHRVLKGWAEGVRDARASLGDFPPAFRPVLSTAVKRLYKDAVGGFQRKGMRISRGIWGHTIIDLWRATLLRRTIRVHASQGVWPVSVQTDSLTYADCVPVQPTRGATKPFPSLTDELNVTSCAIGCGCAPEQLGQLGAYKHERAWTTADWQAAHKPKEPRPARAPRIPRPRRELVNR